MRELKIHPLGSINKYITMFQVDCGEKFIVYVIHRDETMKVLSANLSFVHENLIIVNCTSEDEIKKAVIEYLKYARTYSVEFLRTRPRRIITKDQYDIIIRDNYRNKIIDINTVYKEKNHHDKIYININEEISNSYHDWIDYSVSVNNGKCYSLTSFTPSAINHALKHNNCISIPGLYIDTPYLFMVSLIKQINYECLVDAACKSIEIGLEKIGIKEK